MTSWKSLAALSVLALAACSQKTENTASNAVNDTENALSNAANATGNLVDNAAIALTPTPSPQEFVDKAAKSDAFEIAAAEIAEKNATLAGVKDFAKMMVTAHKESTAKIKKAAAAAMPAITPDATLTDDQKSELDKLRGLKGEDFDKAYIDNQTEAHEDALSLMKKYAADGGVESLKTAAGEIAPIVQEHLDKAKALDKKD
ncbi:MAG: DUF4142 domain-containing protein [Sphingobium sp.]|nr:DUF4142 domain-containing protein [Sphingobium sp.]